MVKHVRQWRETMIPGFALPETLPGRPPVTQGLHPEQVHAGSLQVATRKEPLHDRPGTGTRANVNTGREESGTVKNNIVSGRAG